MSRVATTFSGVADTTTTPTWSSNGDVVTDIDSANGCHPPVLTMRYAHECSARESRRLSPDPARVARANVSRCQADLRGPGCCSPSRLVSPAPSLPTRPGPRAARTGPAGWAAGRIGAGGAAGPPLTLADIKAECLTLTQAERIRSEPGVTRP